ncbi:hypothetical protein GY45DRAFT_718756 [Cubamyces sp. BRFM 1775]|nr:hypothetical protein GY45DRAFT_718756 [Cubamyces sp. BRFM 1775]
MAPLDGTTVFAIGPTFIGPHTFRHDQDGAQRSVSSSTRLLLAIETTYLSRSRVSGRASDNVTSHWPTAFVRPSQNWDTYGPLKRSMMTPGPWPKRIPRCSASLSHPSRAVYIDPPTPASDSNRILARVHYSTVVVLIPACQGPSADKPGHPTFLRGLDNTAQSLPVSHHTHRRTRHGRGAKVGRHASIPSACYHRKVVPGRSPLWVPRLEAVAGYRAGQTLMSALLPGPASQERRSRLF